jgi:hypothetical protein
VQESVVISATVAIEEENEIYSNQRTKPAEYCWQRKPLHPVTDEWVRRLLGREGLNAQRVRTRKTSTDPAFDRKRTRPDGLSPMSAAQRCCEGHRHQHACAGTG